MMFHTPHGVNERSLSEVFQITDAYYWEVFVSSCFREGGEGSELYPGLRVNWWKEPSYNSQSML